MCRFNENKKPNIFLKFFSQKKNTNYFFLGIVAFMSDKKEDEETVLFSMQEMDNNVQIMWQVSFCRLLFQRMSSQGLAKAQNTLQTIE